MHRLKPYIAPIIAIGGGIAIMHAFRDEYPVVAVKAKAKDANGYSETHLITGRGIGKLIVAGGLLYTLALALKEK